VKRHLSNVFDKTGVSTRLELALFAIAHKLVDYRMPRVRTGVPLSRQFDAMFSKLRVVLPMGRIEHGLREAHAN
jgi:hypothetical protein